jgi:hypothetical protein
MGGGGDSRVFYAKENLNLLFQFECNKKCNKWFEIFKLAGDGGR